jgi:hypothetical protein
MIWTQDDPKWRPILEKVGPYIPAMNGRGFTDRLIKHGEEKRS